MEDDFVKVARYDAPEEQMEFPLESDGTLTLSTVQSHFPSAIGLKYLSSSGAWRGLRAVDNIFDPPRAGWGDATYYITESQKRKASDSGDPHHDVTRVIPNPLLQDMAVLGLPWSTSEEELREYFEGQCGELSHAEIKVDRETRKSRGFGFIRFKTEEGAKAALKDEHYIGGRLLEVKQKRNTPMKLFIGRLPQGTEKEELCEYFSKFGEVTDTYIPSPFRGFGFVTFASFDIGNHVLREAHVFKGVSLNVNKGEESKSFNMKRASRGYNDSRSGDSVRQSSDGDADLKNKLLNYLMNQK